MRRLVLCAILLVGLAAPAWADPPGTGAEASQSPSGQTCLTESEKEDLLPSLFDFLGFDDLGKPVTLKEAWRKYFGALWERAELGSPHAQWRLGWLLETGNAPGIAQHYAHARKWYRRAAEQCNAESQFKLGFMYEKGLGVLRDYAEAVRWYRPAAEQDHYDAQLGLARMYEDGKGVPRDYVRAYMWRNLAVSKMLGGTMFAGLDALEEKMTPDQIAEAQRMAQEWLARHREARSE